MKIELTVKQKIKKINRSRLFSQARKICDLLDLPDKTISILLCDDPQIKVFNKKFFNRDVFTDVIAFPLDDERYFGEIIISLERAVKVCGKYNNTWQDEFLTYLVHGILHLCGFEDTTAAKKKKMFKKQDQVFGMLRGR